MKNCPYCNAEIQDNASFCLYCMKELVEKPTVVPTKKRRPRKIFISVAVILVITLAITSVTGIYLYKNRKIVEFEDFKSAAILVTERFGYEKLWSPSELMDVKGSKADDCIMYSTATNYNLDLSVLFFGGGREVVAIISNITDSTMSNAIDLSVTITDSVYNNYLSDIKDFLTDDVTYGWYDFPDNAAETFEDTFGVRAPMLDNIDESLISDMKFKIAMLYEENDANMIYLLYTLKDANGNITYEILLDYLR